MSKQQEKQNQFTIYVQGQAVPVSEEVYRVYHHYERKEEYFSCDRKRGKFQQDTGTFLPAREDSYDRLLEQDQQFASPDVSTEDQAVSEIWLESLARCLTPEERKLLYKLYFQGKTERETCRELGISKPALHRRKVKLLEKIKSFIEKES